MDVYNSVARQYLIHLTLLDIIYYEAGKKEKWSINMYVLAAQIIHSICNSLDEFNSKID